nr:putative ORF1 [Marmot picobirnavirus]
MTNNQIQFARLKEDSRHNVVTEKETGRHNQQQEAIGWSDSSARHKQVAVAGQQVQLGYSQLAETMRHNVEQETNAKNETLVHKYSAEADAKYKDAMQAINWGKLDLQAQDQSVRQALDQMGINIQQQKVDIEQFRANLELFDRYYKLYGGTMDALKTLLPLAGMMAPATGGFYPNGYAPVYPGPLYPGGTGQFSIPMLP